MKTSAALACCVFAASVALASPARAQTREPLCVTVEARRLLTGPWLGASGSDRLVAQPLVVPGPGGERFVVAVRDPEHTLRVGDARALPRTLDELEYGPPAATGEAAAAQHAPPGAPGAPPRPAGLVVLRLSPELRVVGAPEFVPDPVQPTAREREGEDTAPPGIPTGVSLASGVLVLEHIGGDVYATVVPPSGPVPAPRRVAQSPTVRSNDEHRGFVWLTATARGDGAIALAGTDQGDVMALRFDRAGALAGPPTLWTQRVGGPMELLPTGPEGPIAALLGRPVRGTGPDNEQARVQVLVTLSDALTPVGEPAGTGFAQFPLAYALRGRTVVVFQWAQQQGVAIATLPITPRRLGEQLPRLWYAQPPLEGVLLGHAAQLGRGNILYNVVAYGDPTAGGVHGHVAWVPPSGVPTIRRDVLPVRARLLAPPGLIPAADGVVAITASYDETGGAVDAFHVRCDLVALPETAPAASSPAPPARAPAR